MCVFPDPFSQAEFGGGALYKAAWSEGGRLSEIGFEDLTLKSEYDAAVGIDADEAHGYSAVVLDYVEHAWVARVSCWHFVFACVDVADWAQKVTVANSSNYDPASLVTGARRYSFNLDGALALFARLMPSEMKLRPSFSPQARSRSSRGCTRATAATTT